MSRLKQLQGVLPYLFFGMLVVVTYLMLIELGPPRGGWPYWDKVQHMAVFTMLATLGFLAHERSVFKVVIGLVAYGGLIEWLQGQLTVTRMPSIGDWMADVAGILLVCLFVFAYRRCTILET